MKRLYNYYCWNTIEDWMKAQKCGLVKLQEADIHIDIKEPDKYMNHLLELAEHDCFPLSVVCLKKKEGYYLILNHLVYQLFQFLNNEIFLERADGEKILFDNFDHNRKSDIVKAQIHSVWIDISKS